MTNGKTPKVARTYRFDPELIARLEDAAGARGMTGFLEDAIREKLEGGNVCPSCSRRAALGGAPLVVRQGVVSGPRGPRGFRPAR